MKLQKKQFLLEGREFFQGVHCSAWETKNIVPLLSRELQALVDILTLLEPEFAKQAQAC
jgi:hypothetical protein